MEMIRSHLSEPAQAGDSVIAVSVDRSTLLKRRWRGMAEDGREFGFDLDYALSPGEVIFRDGSKCYVMW